MNSAYKIGAWQWMFDSIQSHDDVIKWKHFPCQWPFVWVIHRSPVNSPHKGQWRWAVMFSLICARINDWVNNREAGDLRRHRAHYGVTVMAWHWMFDLIQSYVQTMAGKHTEWTDLEYILRQKGKPICLSLFWCSQVCGFDNIISSPVWYHRCLHICQRKGFIIYRTVRSHVLFSSRYTIHTVYPMKCARGYVVHFCSGSQHGEVITSL